MCDCLRKQPGLKAANFDSSLQMYSKDRDTVFGRKAICKAGSKSCRKVRERRGCWANVGSPFLMISCALRGSRAIAFEYALQEQQTSRGTADSVLRTDSCASIWSWWLSMRCNSLTVWN